jgi:hypothetical protein
VKEKPQGDEKVAQMVWEIRDEGLTYYAVTVMRPFPSEAELRDGGEDAKSYEV